MYFIKSLLAVLRFYDLGDKKRAAHVCAAAILLKYQLSELLGAVKAGLFPFNRIP
jgi:hypothetical protein